jgi:hypothetical protein
VTEGHRITLTYNLRAVHKQQWPAPFADAAAQSEQDNAEESCVSIEMSAQASAAGSSGSWLTPGDVSASAELAAELKRLVADNDWHPKGEQC